MVFATMLRRTETSHRFYLQRPMVFLFSRPILPYYNKGKKTIYSYLNFIFFFLFLSDCVAHSANLECVLFLLWRMWENVRNPQWNLRRGYASEEGCTHRASLPAE